ncbi:hypothetical protein E8E01_04755 [Methylorubrum populi]|uniref:hypothetical protein n=1 Tax=Methylorubrum populi TaxID=223967 RepID=UPI0011537586|nr:hypothetical protein [Methylorubrum populi]QDI79787.1 hypothetical protein E8E01_04755 [Methylorubrum populi]
MADHANSTPAPNPIVAIRQALERHFAERGITVDLDAVLLPTLDVPKPEPACHSDRRLARAYLDLEEVVAELTAMARITDMVVAQTVSRRSAARACLLSEDHADALEYAVDKLAALSRVLNHAYASVQRRTA